MNIATGYTAGDVVRGVARVRSVASGFDADSIYTYVNMLVGGNNISTQALSYISNKGTGLLDPVDGLFMTPEIIVPASVTQMNMTLMFGANACSFDVRQFGIFKVVKP